MMGVKVREFQPLPREVSLEELVPTENFYRDLEERLDLSFVREMVAPLYARGGRPSVDPVVFFKLQLVMFFEDLRSERQLVRVAADRLSIRWYLGYDLFEPLPDHSSLTKIRERYGLSIFQRFFERIVEVCIEAGLVWGKELYLDATKVEANASADSMKPRFAVEAHLSELFCSDEESPIQNASQEVDHEVDGGVLLELPSEESRDELGRANAENRDWISRIGRPQREIVRGHYKRKADFLVSSTDPDASLMQRRVKASHPGYHTHYVVDGGKARVILGMLVTPSEVMENQPMLDLVFRSRFRWRIRPRRVTGDTTYGTIENIKSLEDAGIQAYCPLPEWGKRTPFFGKNEFTYNPQRDVYVCPQGEDLRRHTLVRSNRVVKYRGAAAVCNSCVLKSQCTSSLNGREVSRAFEEDYLDRVRAYHKTELYQKSMRKRRVWVEPLFGEGKQFHGMSRFRLRGLEKVNAEALLIASGQNIKRLLIFGTRKPKTPAQVVALRLPVAGSRDPDGIRKHRAKHRWRLTETFFNKLRTYQHSLEPKHYVNAAVLLSGSFHANDTQIPR